MGNEIFDLTIKPKRIEPQSKWGILNLSRVKIKQVKTGYQWKYSYFDGEKIRIISSYDLLKLRKQVLKKGLDWVITDEKKAKETYKLNNEMLKKHPSPLSSNGDYKQNNSSGVKYVYKHQDHKSERGFYWQYRNPSSIGQKQYSSKYLPLLADKINEVGLPWVVKNKELYDKIYNEELDLLKKWS